MTDKRYTLFESHIHDGITISIGDGIEHTFGSHSDPDTTDNGGSVDESSADTCSTSCIVRKVVTGGVFLLLVVAIAFAIYRIVTGELDAVEQLDSLDEISD